MSQHFEMNNDLSERALERILKMTPNVVLTDRYDRPFDPILHDVLGPDKYDKPWDEDDGCVSLTDSEVAVEIVDICDK